MNKSTSFSKKYPEALIKKMAKDFWDKKENRDKYRFLYRRYFFKQGVIRMKIFMWLLLAALSFMAGYKYAQNVTTSKLVMASRLDKIARDQIEKMRPKAYVFVYNDKKHIYLASRDKAEEYLVNNYMKISRVWSCDRDRIK